MDVQILGVLCNHNQPKTASVYCIHEIPEMTWNATALATNYEHALSMREAEWSLETETFQRETK